MFIPLANEAHTVSDLAVVGGPLIVVGALIGAGGARLNAPENERDEATRKGFLVGGIIAFLLVVGGGFAVLS